MFNLKKSFIPIFVFVIFLMSSCTQYKKVVYMQDRYELEDTARQTISVKDNGDIKLMAGDNLYINVYGTDLGQIGIFNKQPFTQTNFTEYSLFIQGYLVDDEGYVELPVIGKMHVVGKTLTETQQSIQREINEYITGAVVEVRLLSFQITVMGEVRRPGTYTFLRREISILEALGKSGDILDFGDRQSILLLRKNEGLTETIELDLTDSKFITSEYFWLEPNDIIYVKPLRSKMVSVNSTTISIALASITTLILMLNYIQP